MIENLCHAMGCEEPSCCFNNELEIYRHEVRYFNDATPVRTEEEARQIIMDHPDEALTLIVEQPNIMDYPSQYLILNSKECINLTPEGNCKFHGKIMACGPNTPIGGKVCRGCRLRDGKLPVLVDYSA